MTAAVDTARSGAALDLDALYREHRRRLCRYVAANETTQRGDAEDIVQDAFTWAWRYRNRAWMVPRNGVPPIALLYHVTKQSAIRHWRRNRPAMLLGDCAEALADPGASASPTAGSGFQRATDRDRMRALGNLLPSLTPRRRRVLHLRYWEGMTWPEVADHMGITVGAAKTLEDFALKQLQQQIVDPADGAGVQRRRKEAVLAAIGRDPSLLDRLPARQREAIQLRYVDGLTYRQMVERMGVNQRTVSFHLDRARTRILAESEVSE